MSVDTLTRCAVFMKKCWMRRRLPSQLALSWEGRKNPNKNKTLWNSTASFLWLRRQNICCGDDFSGDGTATFFSAKNGGGEVQACQSLVRLLASDGKMDSQRLWWRRRNWAICFFLLVRLQSEPHLWPRACGSHGLVGMHEAGPPQKVAMFSSGLQFKRSRLIRLCHVNVSRPLRDSVRLFESQ